VRTQLLREITAADFDLARTLDSGQVFHWKKIDRGFIGAIGAEPIYIEQRGEMLQFAGASEKLVRDYFALDHPLAEICASFPDDPVMSAARAFCRGLRIIRQPRWECLASFITSSMKQVAHIRQMSHALRRNFGEKSQVRGYAVYTFPCAGRVAKRSEQDLRECALGYRAKNLLATARLVSSGDADLDAWSVLSDPDLLAKLCQLPGVGAKVANCVMLFGYERLCAFPIDVWIARVLQQQYFPRRRKMTEKQMRDFVTDYFGAQGGYAQQYLFHHARTTARKARAARNFATGSARKEKTARKKISGGRRAVGALGKWDTTARVPPIRKARKPVGHGRTVEIGNKKSPGLSEVGA
jgi:N-glycosylase/DNA lyase